jgi:acyl-CoA dehydrogenase
VIREWIAEARIEIESARLLVMKAAEMIDTVGQKEARNYIAMIKVAVPQMALKIVDRAIQVYGAAGVGPDFPLASLYARLRTLRIVDGPDEVHKLTIARRELRRVGAHD